MRGTHGRSAVIHRLADAAGDSVQNPHSIVAHVEGCSGLLLEEKEAQIKTRMFSEPSQLFRYQAETGVGCWASALCWGGLVGNTLSFQSTALKVGASPVVQQVFQL